MGGQNGDEEVKVVNHKIEIANEFFLRPLPFKPVLTSDCSASAIFHRFIQE